MQYEPRSGSNQIVKALISHFRASRDQAVAQLNVYVNSPVGVADHPNIVEDCTVLVKQVTEAEDCLRTLNNLFVPTPAGEQ